MLLLWILGHRLSDDQVGKLISTAIGDALPKDDSGALLDELHRLDSVKRVLVDLRRMIKTKLPLPPGQLIANAQGSIELFNFPLFFTQTGIPSSERITELRTKTRRCLEGSCGAIICPRKSNMNTMPTGTLLSSSVVSSPG